jgi:hypothetical protein
LTTVKFSVRSLVKDRIVLENISYEPDVDQPGRWEQSSQRTK